MKTLVFLFSLSLVALHVQAFGSTSLDYQAALIPGVAGKLFSQILPLERNSAEKSLMNAFKKKVIADLKGWKDPFLESKTNKATKEFQELDRKKSTGVSKKEKDSFYQLAYGKNQAGNSAHVLSAFLSLLIDTANNVSLRGNTGDIHGIVSLGNSNEKGAAGGKGDRLPEKNGRSAKDQSQEALTQFKPGKRKRKKEKELDFEVQDLSPRDAAKHFLNTVNQLAREHNISIKRIIGNNKCKGSGYIYFSDGSYITSSANVEEIFVDFILFTEGLLRDQKFVYSDEADKYRSGQKITNNQVELIDSIFSEMFARKDKQLSDRNHSYRRYYLRELLSDYLYENYRGFGDVGGYQAVGHATFPFFEKMLFGEGYFSEFAAFMSFTDQYKVEIITELNKSFSFIDCKNEIIAVLRGNDKLRMAFNEEVMAGEFNRRWLDILDDMFQEKPDSVGQALLPDNPINLKFGEELEYDLVSKEEDQWGGPSYYYLTKVDKYMKKLGANKETDYDPKRYTFDGHFYVAPFVDFKKWLEVNCTPYHDGDAGAEKCFKKVFKLVDLMIKDGFIDHASGHKHVDALSATHGNPGVLLELQREIESNPYLTRAFGNNDRIVKKDEGQWYKLFSDYAALRSLAIERMNWMIATYNEKLAGVNYGEGIAYWLTDSEKLEKLKQFSKLYSHFVQLAPLQNMFGEVGDVFLDKYMAVSLLHIPGTEIIDPYGTIEFRFFRCPENMQELKLINQFLKALFEYIHERRMRNEPIESVPDDIKASKDYTPEEVLHHTVEYLQKLGLNPADYQSFLNKVSKDM
ncbi:hypothetical protein [Endozoicomonas sp. 2B-B]